MAFAVTAVSVTASLLAALPWVTFPKPTKRGPQAENGQGKTGLAAAPSNPLTKDS